MEYITGKDFMFYVECKTLTGSVMLPLCSAESVQLSQSSRKREVTKAPESKSSRWVYGIIDGTISVDGIVPFTSTEIQQLIVSVNNDLLTTNDQLVSVGGVAADQLNPYFCLENALNEWEYIQFAFNDGQSQYKGYALATDINNTWQPYQYRKFSCSCTVDGDISRFHVPAPTNLTKIGQSNTLPTETVDSLNLIPSQSGSIWTSGFTLEGTPLPSGKVSTLGLDYTVQIGDDLTDIVKGLAVLINAALPTGVIRAYTDDDTLKVEKDNDAVTEPTYTAHTSTLRSVYLQFASPIPYDFYRARVQQGANEWYIDVASTTPTLILPVGSYVVSVSGMGPDLTYSDYSDSINVTVS